LDEYISQPWYVQQQQVNRYLPEDRFFCVRADYEKKRWWELPWQYSIRVNNQAQDADGNIFGADFGLYAYVRGPENAQLAVSPGFLPRAFAGDYWVIAYNEADGYALISGGQPTVPTTDGKCKTGDGINESGLWIFTRQQTVSDDLVERVRGIAEEQGFDTSVLKEVIQEGCTYDDRRRMDEVGVRGSA
jgi:lipocalin